MRRKIRTRPHAPFSKREMAAVHPSRKLQFIHSKMESKIKSERLGLDFMFEGEPDPGPVLHDISISKVCVQLYDLDDPHIRQLLVCCFHCNLDSIFPAFCWGSH